MSDPYNSAGPGVLPVAQPAPDAPAKPKIDPIARLDVSESWKRRFRLIEKAGGPELPRFRDLSFGERFGLNFNLLAFLFGPVYYLVKGLWRQAVVYFVCAVAGIVLFDAMGLEALSAGVGYAFASLCALRANLSYYRKSVLGDVPWF